MLRTSKSHCIKPINHEKQLKLPKNQKQSLQKTTNKKPAQQPTKNYKFINQYLKPLKNDESQLIYSKNAQHPNFREIALSPMNQII
jgi:hypothetical protein